MALDGNEGIEDRIMAVRRRDRRFGRNAYYFVLDSLDHTMVSLGRDTRVGEERHVTGRDLLEGIRDLEITDIPFIDAKKTIPRQALR